MTEPKRTRGRPRTQEVIDRDEQIFQAIAGSDRAVTKYEISAGTGVPVHKVYTSLRRLSLLHRVTRVYVINKQHYWSDRDFGKPAAPTPVAEQPALIPVAVFYAPE